MYNELFENMMEKKANLELQYEGIKNENQNLFGEPKVKMEKSEKNKKPVERKMTHHKGKGRPSYVHEFKQNSPYQHN